MARIQFLECQCCWDEKEAGGTEVLKERKGYVHSSTPRAPSCRASWEPGGSEVTQIAEFQPQYFKAEYERVAHR
jgi:hypothetical protein